MYDDVEYARSRLLRTIVRDDNNDPVQVEEIARRSGVMQACCSPLGGEGATEVDEYGDIRRSGRWVNMSDMNLEPVPLGFCLSSRGKLLYLARRPMRSDYRQGLRQQNTINILSGRGYHRDNDRNLANTISGKFPPFRTASEVAFNEGVDIPFHRHFALRGEEIHYKWLGKIGTTDRSDKGYELLPSFDYLEDMLKEAINE